jgi:hypothetical protein
LPSGFYRIESLTGLKTISYPARYGDFSYNYYDDAGRLLASVAPKGVVLGTTASPSFTTTYLYNAAGELLKVVEPDQGTSEFVYRKDGTLRFSQDAQQKQDRKFSYSNYDRAGRTLESGVYQMASTVDNTQAFEAQLNAVFGSESAKATALENKTRSGGLTQAQCSQQVSTWYDLPFDGSYEPNGNNAELGTRKQRFVIGAVSKTSNAQTTTWYSYDELGQVEWLVQHIPGLTAAGTAKTIDYSYDLLGNVLSVDYQRASTTERFVHTYSYDVDQRLTQVQTSRDGTTQTLQAKYYYYTHGPLKRVELADGLQGIDYVYTVQGWLKSLNHADKTKDPGKDGVSGQTNAAFAPDAFGMTMEYFSGDYTRSGTGIASMAAGANPSYNGNLQTMSWHRGAALI